MPGLNPKERWCFGSSLEADGSRLALKVTLEQGKEGTQERVPGFWVEQGVEGHSFH